MGCFVAQGHDGARKRQGPSRLLVLALLVHKILQDPSLEIQHEVPGRRDHRASVFSLSKEEEEQNPSVDIKGPNPGCWELKVPARHPHKPRTEIVVAPEQRPGPFGIWCDAQIHISLRMVEKSKALGHRIW